MKICEDDREEKEDQQQDQVVSNSNSNSKLKMKEVTENEIIEVNLYDFIDQRLHFLIFNISK